MKALALSVFLAASAAAHEGPPYAIFVDRALGPYTVSLWGDPDVGTGTFFVLFDGPPQGDGTEVRLEVWPVSARLAPASAPAVREPLRSGQRFVSRPVFDAEERWNVRVVLSGPRGMGEATEAVDVTPPDLGKSGLWFFALPFLGVGALWAKALLTRRR
ncbi:hypothetical protein EPO15_12205 [bacterium]|nr:MAG: hypothetical protein EPO15_12205 [bacterium]